MFIVEEGKDTLIIMILSLLFSENLWIKLLLRRITLVCSMSGRILKHKIDTDKCENKNNVFGK